MIEIDGSYLEGGGAIIRVATALSAITEKPVKIFNIRAKRCNPGLRTQHLEGIRALAELCNAKIKGVEIGSTEIEFYPGKINKNHLSIEIPTAGSIGLLLQSIMIAATKIEKDITIDIKGGATNGKWAAPLNYIKNVLLPILNKMGYHASIEIKKYGYYPKGGADVIVNIYPSELIPISLIERGNLIAIKGISHCSSSLKSKNVAERIKESAEKHIMKELQSNSSKHIINENTKSLKNEILQDLEKTSFIQRHFILNKKSKIEPQVEIKYVDTTCPGCGIELFAVYENTILGADGLGEQKKSAETVGKEAAEKLIKEINSDAAVDEYAEDQLLPYMALATEKDESKMKVPKLTNHTRTNIWVTEKFLPVKFEIDEKERTITCRRI